MDELLKELKKLTEQLKVGPSPQQIAEAQELLGLARDDLLMSRTIYDTRLYAGAVYHLQQCAEKAAKAMFLQMGVLDNKTIRTTGHDAPELFLRMAELPWAKLFAGMLAAVPGISMTVDTAAAQDVIDKKKADMARLVQIKSQQSWV